MTAPIRYNGSMEKIIINKTNCPVLLAAINFLRADEDLRQTKSQTVKKSYKVWSDVENREVSISFNLEQIEKMEKALALLSIEDLNEFSAGDYDIKMLLIEKYPDLALADDFLEAIFEC